jgi:hypothetical protein
MDVDDIKQEDQLRTSTVTFRDGAHTTEQQSAIFSYLAASDEKILRRFPFPSARSVIPKDSLFRFQGFALSIGPILVLITFKDSCHSLLAIFSPFLFVHEHRDGQTESHPIENVRVAHSLQENILLCAPTGAGKKKKIFAAMAIPNSGLYKKRKRPRLTATMKRTGKKEQFDLSAFKIVYIAPMKALVQWKNFAERLRLWRGCRELSGDSISRQQISEPQLLGDP